MLTGTPYNLALERKRPYNPADYVRLRDAPLSTADVRAQSNRPSLGRDFTLLKTITHRPKWDRYDV